MAAATHMGGSAHSSSPSSISPPPPWHPVVLVPNHQHQQALYDLDLIIAPSPSPSPTTPTTPQRLRPTAAQRTGKRRRPRPSRKLPTTYISADAASFRRMVHQVTGADDVVLVHQATEHLCRPTTPPSRAAPTTTTTLLPTLDTSAFLLGAARGAGGRGGATPARPGSPYRRGSAVAVGDLPGAALQAEVACGGSGVRGGGGEYSCSNSSAGGGGGVGFPSLEMESWDDDDALFQDQE
jgi:hypothetical protein